MLQKQLFSIVPSHFRKSLNDYWKTDIQFLMSTSLYNGDTPSLACLVSDVYARRHGGQNVIKKTTLLKECYHHYLSLALNIEIPTVYAAQLLSEKYGADLTLKEISSCDPLAYLSADILNIRKRVYNFPYLPFDSALDFISESTHFDSSQTTQFVMSFKEYDIITEVRSLRSNQTDVVNFFKENYNITDKGLITCAEFLIIPNDEIEATNGIFTSRFFSGDVVINESDIEDNQMLILKDALDITNAINQGKIIEADSVGMRAWQKLKTCNSPSKIKSISEKLYNPRTLKLS